MEKRNVPKLRFPGFEGEWEEKKLFEVLDLISGFAFQSELFTDKGLKLVTPKNFTKSGYGYFSHENTKFTVEESNEKFICTANDLLLLLTDLTQSCELLGKPLYVQEQDGDVLLNQRIAKVKCDDSRLSKKWLLNYFLTEPYHKTIVEMASGSTVRHSSNKVILGLETQIPQLDEQTKIATFLTAVDQKITHLKERKSKLESYKKGTMQRLFSQELRFRQDDGSEFPEWEEKTLNETTDCLDSQRKPLNEAERQKMLGTYPYWGANNTQDYIDDYIFDETIVLLAEDGGNFNEFSSRPIANIFSGKCWVNNHTHVLRGKPERLTCEYLYYSIVHKDITAYVSGGTRSKLTKGEMMKIPLNIPSLPEQAKIANFLSAIDEKIALCVAQLEKTERWKKGLLQQLFV